MVKVETHHNILVEGLKFKLFWKFNSSRWILFSYGYRIRLVRSNGSIELSARYHSMKITFYNLSYLFPLKIYSNDLKVRKVNVLGLSDLPNHLINDFTTYGNEEASLTGYYEDQLVKLNSVRPSLGDAPKLKAQNFSIKINKVQTSLSFEDLDSIILTEAKNIN